MTRWRDKPFALIGVHVGGGDAADLKRVMQKENLPWRTFVDEGSAGQGPIAKRLNLGVIPTMFLIDDAGIIRERWAGAPPAPKVIDAAIERLLRAPESRPK